nr:PREDICTED: uncharacterized protein LOC105663551 [Megachile rotundata]
MAPDDRKDVDLERHDIFGGGFPRESCAGMYLPNSGTDATNVKICKSTFRLEERRNLQFIRHVSRLVRSCREDISRTQLPCGSCYPDHENLQKSLPQRHLVVQYYLVCILFHYLSVSF